MEGWKKWMITWTPSPLHVSCLMGIREKDTQCWTQMGQDITKIMLSLIWLLQTGKIMNIGVVDIRKLGLDVCEEMSVQCSYTWKDVRKCLISRKLVNNNGWYRSASLVGGWGHGWGFRKEGEGIFDLIIISAALGIFKGGRRMRGIPASSSHWPVSVAHFILWRLGQQSAGPTFLH